MNVAYPNAPWQLSFSFGRALQDLPLKLWGGQAASVAHLTSLARAGQYDERMESELAVP